MDHVAGCTIHEDPMSTPAGDFASAFCAGSSVVFMLRDPLEAPATPKGLVCMAIQTLAGVKTERLPRVWQGYYRARRRVRQAKNAGARCSGRRCDA